MASLIGVGTVKSVWPASGDTPTIAAQHDRSGDSFLPGIHISRPRRNAQTVRAEFVSEGTAAVIECTFRRAITPMLT